jgi:hypothetical protein
MTFRESYTRLSTQYHKGFTLHLNLQRIQEQIHAPDTELSATIEYGPMKEIDQRIHEWISLLNHRYSINEHSLGITEANLNETRHGLAQDAWFLSLNEIVERLELVQGDNLLLELRIYQAECLLGTVRERLGESAGW